MEARLVLRNRCEPVVYAFDRGNGEPGLVHPAGEDPAHLDRSTTREDDLGLRLLEKGPKVLTPLRTSMRLLAFVVVLATGLLITPATFARSAGWTQHKCNVVAVTWVRTHHPAKPKLLAYVKQLKAQHGCTFAHMP